MRVPGLTGLSAACNQAYANIYIASSFLYGLPIYEYICEYIAVMHSVFWVMVMGRSVFWMMVMGHSVF